MHSKNGSRKLIFRDHHSYKTGCCVGWTGIGTTVQKISVTPFFAEAVAEYWGPASGLGAAVLESSRIFKIILRAEKHLSQQCKFFQLPEKAAWDLSRSSRGCRSISIEGYLLRKFRWCKPESAGLISWEIWTEMKCFRRSDGVYKSYSRENKGLNSAASPEYEKMQFHMQVKEWRNTCCQKMVSYS